MPTDSARMNCNCAHVDVAITRPDVFGVLNLYALVQAPVFPEPLASTQAT